MREPVSPLKKVMREVLEGIVSDYGAALERRSDRPEFTPPAFQFLLPVGGDNYVSPDTETSLQEIVDFCY